MVLPHSRMICVTSYGLFLVAYSAALLKCVPSYKKCTLSCRPTSMDPGHLFPISILNFNWIRST